MTQVIHRFRMAVRHPDMAARLLAGLVAPALSVQLWSLVAMFQRKGQPPPITYYECGGGHTEVDYFWAEHTIIEPPLSAVKTAWQDKRYLKWRFSAYPLFREFMDLWGSHDDQTILDYGCGPGNDLVGFLTRTGARKVIGVDISAKALRFASNRLALHRIDPERVELICVSDSADALPIADSSADYIYSEGVLHHTTDPVAVLRDFHRVLKPGSQACIMVYNHDSIWLHLYVAYELMILQNRFSGMNVYDAFAKTTDTEACPIARCYGGHEFISMCEHAGFSAEYVGGYLSLLELSLLTRYRESSSEDERLAEEHRDFLRDLTFDDRGYPIYRGKHAGIGGVYRLHKRGEPPMEARS